MKKPLISIVFTSYNHKSYLEKSLLSVINQDYPNLEIFVIDDNSNDGSQHILKKIKSNYPQINLILRSKNSGGYVNSLNRDLKYTNGEYLSFIQCDDYISSDYYSKMIHQIDNYENIGAIFCRSNIINSKGVKISDDFMVREKSFRNLIKSYRNLIPGNQMTLFLNFSCVIPNLSGVLISKNAYLELRGLNNDYSVVSDWDFYIRMSSRFNFIYINEKLNNFRFHNKTIRSKTSSFKILSEIGKMFDRNSHLFNINSFFFKIRIGSIIFSYLKDEKLLSLSSIQKIRPIFNKFFICTELYIFFGFLKNLYEYLNKSKQK